MADDDNTTQTPDIPDAPAKKTAAKRAPAKKAAAKKAPAKKAATKKAAAAPADEAPADAPLDVPVDPPAKKAAKKAPAKRAAAKKTAKKADAAPAAAAPEAPESSGPATPDPSAPMVLFKAPETTVTTRTRSRRAPSKPPESPEATDATDAPQPPAASGDEPAADAPAARTPRRRTAKKAASGSAAPAEDEPSTEQDDSGEGADSDDSDDDRDGEGGPRRRRRRGGRRRRKPGDGDDSTSDDNDSSTDSSSSQAPSKDDDGDSSEEGGTRRRRRRRREGDDGGSGGSGDEPSNTVTRVRRPRNAEDEITSIQGSTRLEAKKQRRREGREAGRRRAPIVSEAEFLARRESVDRVMVIRQREELTQIGVLEDKVLVEHYVARESQTSLIGNVYLGRVQNVLPSMEAAFIDIGKGRNAVLYAGEVNWSALGHKDGQPRKIESVLTSGQSILVQVTKDPIGHKGARLTSQVSLAGRFLVYVPDGTTSGISRKLPDTERNRLKTLLKEIVPDTAGVIVRTAAEGASEEELTRDVERLKARWEDIDGKAKGQAPQLLYGEPDLTLKVVRDLFTEDFKKLVIQGDDAWTSVQDYVAHVAPDLQERVQRYESDNGQDIFAAYRVDEQIAKGLDRKVWLPSGGSLVIDRTEAMTVVDVNTGKFTGSGGNLEETVTKNNLEAAEEIVRQLRLRDIGGIIVVDFIDMVLESNRDLVLRRMVECLGRDRTRHQVAEVTSLGLVQMTRKRIGTGLLEAFSENCEHCQGRGVVIHEQPVAPRSSDDAPRSAGGGRRSRGGGGGGGRGRGQDDQAANTPKAVPSPKDVAAMAKPENAAPADDDDETFEPLTEVEPTPTTEPEPDVQPEVQAEPDVQPEPEPEPEPEAPAAEPEAPKVVTRTRRTTRSTATISTTPAEMPSPVVVAPAAAPVEAPLEAPVAAVAEPPKVVTRTRGRRTASATAASATASTAGATEPSTEEPDADASASTVHVPVKKRSRKR
jgi:ribonuclease E